MNSLKMGRIRYILIPLIIQIKNHIGPFEYFNVFLTFPGALGVYSTGNLHYCARNQGYVCNMQIRQMKIIQIRCKLTAN